MCTAIPSTWAAECRAMPAVSATTLQLQPVLQLNNHSHHCENSNNLHCWG
jgi:hypothetical protein